MEDCWLAVGLGNPGVGYELTRHNAGARAVEALAERLGTRLRLGRIRAFTAEARVDATGLVLARPTTFMNESGQAVAPLVRRHRVDPGRLIVVHDDIDLQPAVLRLKLGGGTAGHHGLDSIVSALGTREFYRVRIGVGRPPGPGDPAEWVLKRMTKPAAADLAAAEEAAGEAVLAIIQDGMDRAMNRFNTR